CRSCRTRSARTSDCSRSRIACSTRSSISTPPTVASSTSTATSTPPRSRSSICSCTSTADPGDVTVAANGSSLEVKQTRRPTTRCFGLTDLVERPVSSYSGGERRRLEIARALLSRPDVLFLDEPTVGLDPRIRYELLDLIAELRETAMVTVLLTTHYLEEAER